MLIFDWWRFRIQTKYSWTDQSRLFSIGYNKGLDKDEQKEGFFKKLENIEDKNEVLLKAFSTANYVSKDAKNESDFNYDNKFAYYRFYRDF